MALPARSAVDWFSTGTEHLVAGRLREAIRCLERAVDEAPSPGAHHNLAVALRAHGDLDRARQHATAAARLGGSAPSLALVGSLHSLAGDHDAALETFRRAVAVAPAHQVSRYYLGIALAASGDRDGAIEELSSLLEGSQLPVLVRERIRAQLVELADGSGPIARDLCSTPLVTEIVDARRRAIAPPPASRPTAGGATIDVAEAASLVDGARRIVALTGAGVSSASGLATRKELWQRHDRDDAVSIWRFRRDPSPLWTVVRELLDGVDPAPNAAHRALAAMPRLGAVVTQNVEGLHQAAGTPCPVLELHGTLLATRCDSCGARPGRTCAELLGGPLPPACACGGVLRPDVVLFGEWVDRELLARAAELCAACDLLLVVGTAADVAPAADLPLLAAARGTTVVEIKRNPSRLQRTIGAKHLPGRAEDVLPALVEAMR
ncbi:MAG: tetratricopeptide repeat protein [Labilithrix sp.]|nr:tetratricopeptide repeat protein [Labilithrix sp.]MCW5811248.1 tetratricopeptide repeat protein [Labilithrix sp.]